MFGNSVKKCIINSKNIHIIYWKYQYTWLITQKNIKQNWKMYISFCKFYYYLKSLAFRKEILKFAIFNNLQSSVFDVYYSTISIENEVAEFTVGLQGITA